MSDHFAAAGSIFNLSVVWSYLFFLLFKVFCFCYLIFEIRNMVRRHFFIRLYFEKSNGIERNRIVPDFWHGNDEKASKFSVSISSRISTANEGNFTRLKEKKEEDDYLRLF